MSTRSSARSRERRLILSSIPCPRCCGILVRIPRRGIDKLASLLSPVKRFQCGYFACQWTGNLALPRQASVSYGSVSPDALPGGMPAAVPKGTRSKGYTLVPVAISMVAIAGTIYIGYCMLVGNPLSTNQPLVSSDATVRSKAGAGTVAPAAQLTTVAAMAHGSSRLRCVSC